MATLKGAPESSTIVFGVSISVTLVMIIIAVFFIDKDIIERAREKCQSQKIQVDPQNSSHTIVATLGLLKDTNLILLLPITVTTGLVDSFISCDFTKAFITCSLHIHYVGVIMVTYGVAATVASSLAGWAANAVGRGTFMVGAFVINVTIFANLLHWSPTPDQKIFLFLVMALQGVADSICRSYLFGLYAEVFQQNKEAGFSNLEIWEAVGFVLGYSWHSFLCVGDKISILLVFIPVGYLGFGFVELRLHSFWTKAKTLLYLV